MSTRSYNNPRNLGDGPKGQSRKSAGRAKPKSAAAGSVYIKNADAKRKVREEEKKEKEKEKAKAAKEDETIIKGVKAIDGYQRWRKIWLIFIIVAIVGVAVSWGSSVLIAEGAALESLMPAKAVISIVGLIVGYGGILVALYVDFKHVRPVRKAQEAYLKKTKRESKKEAKHREAAEAAKTAKPGLLDRFKKKDQGEE